MQGALNRGVSCAAQPKKAGRQTPGLAKPRQVGRGAAGSNGASVADLARENGSVNGSVNGVHSEGVAQIALNGGSVLARVSTEGSCRDYHVRK